MSLEQMEGIIEAVLFTMGDSVEVSKLADAIEQDVDTTTKICLLYTSPSLRD